MGVIVYSFNLDISPKMSSGVLECEIVILQNYMLMNCDKRFCNKNGGFFVLDPVYLSLFPCSSITFCLLNFEALLTEA